MDLKALQAQLEINKTELDDEVIRQPSLFYMVSEQLTDALAERDAAKEELANVDADLYATWRTKLGKSEKGRVTDTMVNMHVQASADHEAAFANYLKAKTKAEKLLALKEAFQQRSYMLRDLVSLYSANYYEDTSMRPTKAQEASHYAANRQRISIARAARGK